jgi:hypothetical protein
MPTQEKRKYRLMFCKRESRSGVIDFDGGDDVDTIYLEQGERGQGMSWTLCAAPQEDVEPLNQKDRGELSFFDIIFPIRWDDLIAELMKTRRISSVKATGIASKARKSGMIICPARDGLWERSDGKFTNEKPDF